MRIALRPLQVPWAEFKYVSVIDAEMSCFRMANVTSIRIWHESRLVALVQLQHSHSALACLSLDLSTNISRGVTQVDQEEAP